MSVESRIVHIIKHLRRRVNYSLGHKRLKVILLEKYNIHIGKNRLLKIMGTYGLKHKKRMKDKKPYQKKYTEKDITKIMSILKSFHERRSYTWEEIAQEVGVDRSTVMRWIKSENLLKEIRRNNLKKLEEFLLKEGVWNPIVPMRS